MVTKVSCLALVAVAFLGWLVAPVSAAAISYEYIYDTLDGTGATAYQPQTTGNPADSTHNASYTTYSSGELNDGTYFVGAYGSGYWDTGNQVGTKNPDYPTSRTAPSIVAKLDPSQSWDLDTISVNYMVDSRVGIHAPASVTVYFSADGTNWSSGTSLGGWTDANPSYDPILDVPSSDLYANNMDVSGISAAQGCNYVRLDIGSTNEWGGLVEVSFNNPMVPEPSVLVLLGMGTTLFGIPARAWRKRK